MANSCISLRQSDGAILKKFKKEHLKPVIFHEMVNGKKIRFIAASKIDYNKPTLFFVHGAPGSATDFSNFLKDKELIKLANLISIDRLGYGYSDYGHAETSIEKQAETIYAIAKKFTKNKLILIGWSYGGPIIVKIAAEHPTKINHLVLLAPAISPKDEKYFKIAKLAQWTLTKWFVPKGFRVAEAEKLAHVKELTKMLGDWKKLKTPITYYHGDKDKLVPYANIYFIKNHVSNKLLKVITLKNANHFIPWKNYEIVKQELITLLKNDQ